MGKKERRIFFRTIILLGIAISIFIAIKNVRSDNIIATSLIIIASAISVYSAQRLIEKEEDSREPFIEIKSNFTMITGYYCSIKTFPSFSMANITCRTLFKTAIKACIWQ